jgi:transcriptional regulator with XRE-family HTH domain
MSRLFGEKLRYLRRQSGITQGELARRLSLASYTHISRLEVDRRTPSLDLVVRIAAVFHQPTDYLLRDAIAVEAATPSSFDAVTLPETTSRQFGTKLRVLRQRAGWGQTELARKLGLKRRGYISNLEAGRKAPSPELVVQIADLFGVTTDYLLLDHDAPSPLQARGADVER